MFVREFRIGQGEEVCEEVVMAQCFKGLEGDTAMDAAAGDLIPGRKSD